MKEITITIKLDKDWKMETTIKCSGEPSIFELLGALEVVKNNYITEANKPKKPKNP